MTPTTTEQPLDLSRLTREERRRIEKRLGVKIPGRNLGYNQKIHGSWSNYYKLREEEIAKDLKDRNENSSSR